MAVIIFAASGNRAVMALLLLAGLQVVPGRRLRRGQGRRRTTWQRFRRITLPLLTPAILVALIFRTLDALRIFDLPYVLTQGDGTTTLSLQARGSARDNGIIGLGSALSVLTFVTVMIVSFLYIRIRGRQRPRPRGGLARGDSVVAAAPLQGPGPGRARRPRRARRFGREVLLSVRSRC